VNFQRLTLEFYAIFLCFIGYLKRNSTSLLPSGVTARYFRHQRRRQSSLWGYQVCIFTPDGCGDTVFGVYTVLFWLWKTLFFKAQLSIAVTRLTAKCFTSKFAASQFVTRSSRVPSFISLPTSPIEILSFKSKSQSQGLARGWFIGSACPDPTSLPPAAFFV